MTARHGAVDPSRDAPACEDPPVHDRGRVAIIGAVIGFLVLATFARQMVNTTVALLDDQSRLPLAAQAQAFDCMEERVTELVPRGSTVYFEGDDLWRQRAIEGTYPRYVVKTNPRRADYVVTVGATGEGCGGVNVNVRAT